MKQIIVIVVAKVVCVYMPCVSNAIMHSFISFSDCNLLWAKIQIFH